MSAKTPLRVVFDGSNNATGLAEFQSGEFIALSAGGLGASLSIGSAGQVLKVNSGASALEFGNVEAVFNIDGMTDGTSITLADGDVFAISDGGTEKRITASQIKTYVSGTGGTAITALDLDGATDIGAALADADLFIVDDGAGGTNRKMAASRIKTYVADITLTTAAQTNITSLGTLTSLTVDDITIDGSTISDSADFTIDAGNDIILDGDQSIKFMDGGSLYMSLSNSSGIRFTSQISDNDMLFRGNDGGSFITALTLDMSEAGAATFNDKIILGANKAIEFGDAGESISGDGTDMTITGNIVKIDAASRIILDAAENRIDLLDSGTEFARFVNNGGQLQIRTGSSSAVGVSFDSSGGATFGQNVAVTGDLTVNGTTTTVNSTTVTIDDPIFTLGGDSAPSSDDNKDRGIEFRYHTGSAAKVGFFGYDDSASAFTFIADASNSSEVFSGSAGNVVFGNISIGDSNKVNIGAGNDLQLYHDGSDSFIDDAGTGDLKIRSSFTRIIDISNSHVAATFASSGVNLRHANSVKFTTTSTGATVTGALDVTGAPSIGNDEASFGFNAPNAELKAKNSSGSPAANFDIHTTNSSGTTARVLRATHDGILQLMSGDTVVGKLSNSSSDFVIESDVQDKDIIFKGDDGGSTITALTLDMSAAGNATFNNNIMIAQDAGATTGKILLGAATDGETGDLEVYHDGQHSHIRDRATGDLRLRSTSIKLLSDSSTYLTATLSGSVDLYHNNSKKFETTSAGATVTGVLTADGVTLGANESLVLGDAGETITGDGTNLNIVSSNSLGIDTANGITLDSGSGGTTLKAGGSTTYGTLTSNSGSLSINQTTSDKDIIFTGNDGGSTIEVMRMDMSEGGKVGIGTNAPSRDLHVKKSTSGSPVRFEVNNTSDTAGSHGVISIYSGGTSGGDPYLHFKVDGGEQYSLGIDNSSSDAFVLSNNYGVGSTNLLSIATDGSASFTEKIIMASNKEVQFVDTNESIKSDGSKLIIKSGGTTFNFPTADGSDGQALVTDGSGTFSFADAGSSGFSSSTITTTPGAVDFDLSKTNNAGSAETPFDTTATDAFGSAVGSVFDCMEPIGSSTANNVDLGSSESHVGA